MEMVSSLQRVHIVVSGDVQGVGYRFNVIEVARDLGLTGWVKNNPDGRVEIVAEGSKEKLGNLISWAKKGPALARIDDVALKWQEATNEFAEFEVRY